MVGVALWTAGSPWVMLLPLVLADGLPRQRVSVSVRTDTPIRAGLNCRASHAYHHHGGPRWPRSFVGWLLSGPVIVAVWTWQ